MSVCHCTAYETCFPCRDRQAHREPEPVTAADPALLVPGSEWLDPATDGTYDPEDGLTVRLLSRGMSPRHWNVEVVDDGREIADLYIDPHWQRVSPPPAEAPDVEPATSQVSSSREVEPATDEDIATYEAMAARGALLDPEATRELIARVRQAEERADEAWRYTTEERKRGDDYQSQAALLREQVAAMQAVIEAAWDYTYKPPGHTVLDYAEGLRDAVSALRATGWSK